MYIANKTNIPAKCGEYRGLYEDVRGWNMARGFLVMVPQGKVGGDTEPGAGPAEPAAKKRACPP